MSKKIIFTKVNDLVSDEYFPKPSSKMVPEWYKNIKSYSTENGLPDLDEYGIPVATSKKCMPVFDATTAGYLITTYCDLWIKRNNKGGIDYITSSSINIEGHSVEQAPNHPDRNGHMFYPKWINPWSIKTEKGYSCLFLPPMHQENKYFSIFPGIVDTDNYFSPVNFPFVLKDISFEGLVPAGTPMAQVIPFKRDSWSMKEGSQKELDEVKSINLKLSGKFLNRYKTMFWNKKEYR